MPNYNQSLQSNNTSLQAILNLAKTLPLASGGQLGDHSANENVIIARTISGSYMNSRITNLREYAFSPCMNLTTISLPSVATVGQGAFYACTSLTTVNMPIAQTIGVSAFRNCTSLTMADFPAATQIKGSAFSGCRMLSSLTLGASTICTLKNSNAFTNTPFTGYSASFNGTPYIYVPASLINTYKTATNWTYYSSYFSGIGGAEPGLITFTIDDVTYQAEEGMTWEQWNNSKYNPGFSLSEDVDGCIVCSICNEVMYQSTDDGIGTVFYGEKIIPDNLYWLCDCYGKNLITFTIDNSVTYQAEEGMTWGEWVNSKYNTGGWIDSQYGIALGEDGAYTVFIDKNCTTEVESEELIIANHFYFSAGMGWG